MTKKSRHLANALAILIDLGVPRAQQNERSAVTLLALLDLQPGMSWSQATSPLIGITPIMSWASAHYLRHTCWSVAPLQPSTQLPGNTTRFR